jgi:hypothetical protein
MNETVRTHVLLPREVVDAVDRLVGQRRRSQFLAEAAREKLERADELRRRAERAALARSLMGSLADRSIPEWDTPESAREWVRAGRRARDERLQAAWDEA